MIVERAAPHRNGATPVRMQQSKQIGAKLL
jgi:hypothetical protein